MYLMQVNRQKERDTAIFLVNSEHSELKSADVFIGDWYTEFEWNIEIRIGGTKFTLMQTENL